MEQKKMEPGLFNKSYIEQATFSFLYKPVIDIERDIVVFENGLSKSFEDRAQLTRVPRETNPAVPRFIFQNKSKKRLEVSLVKSSLAFSFKNQIKANAQKTFQKNVIELFSFFKKQESIQIDGFQANLAMRFPLKDKNEDIVTKIKQRFLKIDFDEDLLNSAFSFKIRKGKLNIEYFIGSYNNIYHDVKFPNDHNKNNKELYLKLSNNDGVLTERGASLNIVVTNEWDDKIKELESLNVEEQFSSTLSKSMEEITTAPQQIIFNGKN